jgi:4-amino-4-deoxy-L-arabinose transferase-like glycosyltransferase
MSLLVDFRERFFTPHRTLLVILLVAFVARAVCVIWFRGIIDGEGAEYARMAQNLVSGAGYVGIATDGNQLVFPPLFPFLIAAVSFLTGDAEAAGRVVSVIAGSLVVVPVYLIAHKMYGERIAILAAALTGLHPYFVQLSSTVFCEPTYLTIVLFAIYMAMRAMDNPSARNLFGMGVLYGLAFLVRQEALAYVVVGSVFVGLQIAISQHRYRAAVFSRLPLIALGFLLVAGPYIAWLSEQTGQFRVQGKSPLNISTESRIQQGMSTDEAAFAVAPDLTLTGIWMRPSLTTIRDYKMSAGELVHVLLVRAKWVAIDASATIAGSLELGSPFLFALAVLGLFSRLWSIQRLITNAHIATLLALVPVGLLFTYVVGPRFYVLFVPFLCIWAIPGIIVFSQWAKRSAAMCGLAPVPQFKVGAAARTVALLSVLLPSAAFAAWRLKDANAQRPFKEAIVSLSAKQPAPMRIADTSTLAAFHARADFVWLPYCDEATALRFLAKVGASHVVLRSDLGDRPYLKKWMEEGIPGARQLISMSSRGLQFQVYELGR